MQGYKPELLPMYEQLYGLPDPERMIELLLTIVDPEGVKRQLEARNGN